MHAADTLQSVRLQVRLTHRREVRYLTCTRRNSLQFRAQTRIVAWDCNCEKCQRLMGWTVICSARCTAPTSKEQH